MNPAVVFLKQLGDFVLLQPTLAGLARASGRAVQVHCKPAFKEVCGLMDGTQWVEPQAIQADRLHVYERGSKPAWLAWRARARHKSVVLAKPTERRWYHRWVFDEIRCVHPGLDYRAWHYWRSTPELAESDYQPPRLARPPESWIGSLNLPSEPWLLVHPTSAWKSKCWPETHWSHLVREASASGRPMVLSGGFTDWERQHCRDIAASSGVALTEVYGRTDLRQLLALVAGSAAVLTVDGAVAHLAAALGRPYLVLFGPSNPRHWFRLDSGGVCLSAADFTTEKRPPTSIIPASHAVDALAGLLRGGR